MLSRPGTLSGIEVVQGTTALHGVYLDTYAFASVLSGYLALQYRRTLQTALAGDLVLLEPGRTVVARASDDPQAASVTVFVEPEIVTAMAPSADSCRALVSFDAAVVRGDAADSFATVLRHVIQQPHSAPEETSLIAAIRSAVDAHGTPVLEPASIAPRQYEPTIALALHRAASYLHTHVADPVSLDALARIACLSKYHLTRLFHSFYGLPPHAYQLQLRLAFAKRLISSGLSVANAARTAGFAGPVHMHRHFRARYGVAPGYYAVQRGAAHITAESIAQLSRLPLRE